MFKEEWRRLSKFNGVYFISSMGQVWSKRRRVRRKSKKGNTFYIWQEAQFKKAQLQNNGYLIVHLYCRNKRKACTVHSLVAELFLGPRKFNLDINHKNGIRTDNRACNLEYCTRSENLKNMVQHNTCPMTGASLTVAQVKQIRKLKNKVSAKEIAEQFGIKSPWSIHRIWRGESWAHIL